MNANDATQHLKLGEVRRTPLVQQIAEQLRALIIDGTIPPGTPLLQEKVAAELGVSRTPLREAFRILEQDGLVQVTRATGTAEVVRLTARDAAHLYELREVIDGLAARLAASQPLSAGIKRDLRKYADQILVSVHPFNTREFLQAHTAFHLGIVKASGNGWMSQVDHLVRISSHMLYPVLKTGEERMALSAEEHTSILNAILAGDPEGAETLARAHIRRASQFWLVDTPSLTEHLSEASSQEAAVNQEGHPTAL